MFRTIHKEMEVKTYLIMQFKINPCNITLFNLQPEVSSYHFILDQNDKLYYSVAWEIGNVKWWVDRSKYNVLTKLRKIFI